MARTAEKSKEEKNGDGREKEYLVEQVLEKRIDGEGEPEYLLKWSGYTVEEATWEPASSVNCNQLIREYEEKAKAAKGGRKRAAVAPASNPPTKMKKGGGKQAKKEEDEKNKKRKNTKTANKGKEYEVKQVLEKRRKGGVVEYRIQWEGYDASESTWVKASEARCPVLIADFERRCRQEKKAAREEIKRQEVAKEKEEEMKKAMEEAENESEDGDEDDWDKDSEDGSGDEEDVVKVPERVIGRKFDSVAGPVKYRIKFKDLPIEDGEWLSAEQANCQDLIDQFNARRLRVEDMDRDAREAYDYAQIAEKYAQRMRKHYDMKRRQARQARDELEGSDDEDSDSDERRVDENVMGKRNNRAQEENAAN